MAALDAAIANVAAPQIRADLGISGTALVLDLSGYTLALFATVLAVGVVAGQLLGGLLVSADILGVSWRPRVPDQRAGGSRAGRGRPPQPGLDPRIVADGGFALALCSLVASTVAWGGFLFAFTLYLQEGLGYSALGSGLLFIPYGAGFAVASLGYGRLPGVAGDRGRRLRVRLEPGADRGGRPRPGRPGPRRQRHPHHRDPVELRRWVTLLGSLFLSRAELPIAHAAGHAFTTIALVIAGLALVAAALGVHHPPRHGRRRPAPPRPLRQQLERSQR